MAREVFNEALFVGRGRMLERIEEWANAPNPGHRLCSIVGPPGVGKSWFIAAARKHLQQDGKRLVFWADLSLDLATSRPMDDLTDPPSRGRWLQTLIMQAQKKCGAVRDFNGSVSFEAMLDSFVEDLCHKCRLERAPILLVDGFEEVADDAARKWLEEHIFKRFLGRDCTRLLLTRRDEYALTVSQLRWTEQVVQLSVLEEGEGQQQLQRRSVGRSLPSGITPAEFDKLVQLAVPYRWNHPALNTCLFQRIVQNQQSGQVIFLDCDDLKECLKDIARPATLTPEVFDLLVMLAHIGIGGLSDPSDYWTDLDLRRLGIRPDDQEFERLFELGMGTTIPGGPFRKVGDGIRELVRAWKNCDEARRPGRAT